MAKDKGTKVVTSVGDLIYVTISGQGVENFNEDGYNYTATVILDKDGTLNEPKSNKPLFDMDNVREQLEHILGDTPKGCKLQKVGYRDVFEDDEGNYYVPNAEGEVIRDDEDITDDLTKTDKTAIQFYTNVEFPDGKSKTINVFDKDAKKTNLGDRLIGNGSRGAVSGMVKTYVNGKNYGVSLFLNAIQLTKFEEYEAGAGFAAQEGEFEGVADEESGFTTKTDDDSAEEEKPKKEAKKKVRPKL